MQKKIKVVHLIPSLGLGGAEKVILNLCKGIGRERFSVTVAYWGDDETLLGPFKEAGVEVIKLDLRRVVSFGSVRMIADLLKRSSSDILHTHFIDADTLGFFAALLARVPLVMHIHSYPFPEKITHRLRYRLMSVWAKRVICVSNAVKKYLVRNTGMDPERITVVYNGMDFPDGYACRTDSEKKVLRGSFGISEGCHLIGNVSRMVRCKGQEYLIEAAHYVLKKDPDARFLIVGDGPLRKELEDLANGLGVSDKFVFTGTRHDIDSLFSIMDVFAYPAFDEAMGLAVLEAMAAGKPIAASYDSAIPELIGNGKEGLLVNPHDPAALAGAVLKLLFDPASAEKMASAARVRSRDFSCGAMTSGIESVYEGIVSRRCGKKAAPKAESDGRTAILYIHNKKDISGGERSLINLWRTLDRSRFVPYALLPGEGDLSREARKCAVEVGLLNMPPLSSMNILGIAGAFPKLCAYIKEKRISIVHSCSPRNNIMGALACKLLRVPVIWHERNLIFGGEKDLSRRFSLLADAVICNSRAVAERFSAGGVIPDKVRVVLNGVDLEEFSPREAPEELKRELGASGKKVIGILTNLNRRKRAEYFIRAAQRIMKIRKDVLFIVVGGEFSDEASGRTAELRDMAVMLGLKDNIVFTGFRDDVARLLASFDVSVHVTEKEACSRAIIESMAAGKPVVAMEDGGNPELVENGVSGVLVPPDDMDGFVSSVAELLNDDGKRALLGRKARERAEALFDVRRNARETESIYSELIKGKR